jgi:hypothetical protein
MFQFSKSKTNGCTHERNLNKWHFRSCLGAVDKKHLKIIPPEASQSFYCFNSLVLNI